MSWLSRLTAGLKSSSTKLTSGLSALFGKEKIDASSLEDIEDALISADLGMPSTLAILAALNAHRWDGPISEDGLRTVLADQIGAILQSVEAPLSIKSEHQPHVILLVGVNGSGKTTTAGKLAAKFQQDGHSVMLAAADTFRAAAIEQLSGWGERTDTIVTSGERGGDPAALAFKAIEQAREQNIDVLIIDTAGRLQNRVELMDELAKIIRVIKKQTPDAPHDSLIVLDGTVGQNALTQVKAFEANAGLTGMIITKLDGSARGGILVALAREFNLPVHFIGVGETAEDLDIFRASEFAAALVGIEPQD